MTKLCPRVHALAVGAVLFAGCYPSTSVLDRGLCADAAELTAPETGCTTITLEVTGDDACTPVPDHASLGEGQTLTGTWLRLHHQADRATRLSLRMISSPFDCTVDGAECPYAGLTTGGAVPCSCGPERFASFSLPTDASFRWPLLAPEQDVLLRPVGAIFEVSLCVDDGDSYPSCVPDENEVVCAASNSLHASARCTCFPTCAVDADCPQPNTGTVDAVCSPSGCVLPCSPSDECPHDQECIVTRARSLCMGLGY